jgi:hypothetical protein
MAESVHQGGCLARSGAGFDEEVLVVVQGRLDLGERVEF